jgi:PTH1 family peptidyl-tRNA hydrolase
VHLIVGLGNPGLRYRNTRHNIGFMVADRIAEKLGVSVRQRAYNGLVGRGNAEGTPVALLKPMTMMNLSGRSVSAAARDLGVAADSILVILDEAQLELGRIRVRPSGSAGGHKGMASIIGELGTRDIPRLRVGIGGTNREDLIDHVLASFSRSEWLTVRPSIEDAAEAALTVVRSGVAAAMNTYNG